MPVCLRWKVPGSIADLQRRIAALERRLGTSGGAGLPVVPQATGTRGGIGGNGAWSPPSTRLGAPASSIMTGSSSRS